MFLRALAFCIFTGVVACEAAAGALRRIDSWEDFHDGVEQFFSRQADPGFAVGAATNVVDLGLTKCDFDDLGLSDLEPLNLFGVPCLSIRVHEQYDGTSIRRVTQGLGATGAWTVLDERTVGTLGEGESRLSQVYLTMIDNSSTYEYSMLLSRLESQLKDADDTPSIIRPKAVPESGALGFFLYSRDGESAVVVERSQSGACTAACVVLSEDEFTPIWADLDTSLKTYSALPVWDVEEAQIEIVDELLDSDGDGLTDVEEAVVMSDPLSCDSDGDGMFDAFEVREGLNPTLADSDGDGLDDYYEFFSEDGYDPLVVDTDGDGVDDYEEWENRSDPTLADSDGDGLSDREEIDAGSDPLCSDGDYDGILDIDEINVYHTHPMKSDTDGDGLSDSQELEMGLNPLDADRDRDGLPDGWEVQHGFDPRSVEDANGALGDPDGDGLDNLAEYTARTDPNLADTDGDGLSDYDEVVTHKTNPLHADSDNDGIDDADEVTFGTNAWSNDTDGDGYSDRFEIAHGYNPLVKMTDAEETADSDKDELTDLEEYRRGTDPKNPDTDGDGFLDGWEVRYLYDPLVAMEADAFTSDTDCDGLTLEEEIELGTNPQRYDTDHDGFNDGWEVAFGWDPLENNEEDDDPDNDMLADVDGDGICNYDEYCLDRDPLRDESMATSASVIESDEKNPQRRIIRFKFGGDYATWELEITGLGPDDRSTRRFSTLEFDTYGEPECELCISNRYQLTMHLINSRLTDVYDGEFLNKPIVANWYCWSLTVDGASCGRSYSSYSSERLAGNELIDGPGWKIENESGVVSEMVHVHDLKGGNIADGKSAILIPYEPAPEEIRGPFFRFGPLINSNGLRYMSRYDETFSDSAEVNSTFRFWSNDDSDVSGIASLISDGCDQHGIGSNNRDGQVNGVRDLLDFTPIAVDFKVAFKTGNLDENGNESEVAADKRGEYSWTIQAPNVNVVWTSLSLSDANSFRNSNVSGCGPSLSSGVSCADVVSLSEETDFPEKYLDTIRAGGAVVMLVEGAGCTTQDMVVRTYCGKDDKKRMIREDKLNISISPVYSMYREINLRHALSGGNASIGGNPPNRPPSSCDAGHVVFVHGFNVDETDAYIWSTEVFKRFWQSGLRKNFVTVDWYGDAGMFSASIVGKTSIDYYSNVRNAFLSARPLSHALNSLVGPKTIFAHSLGNMVVSAAISDWGLSYSKYFLVNAAVAAECYPSGVRTGDMIPTDWQLTPSLSLSANWYRRFGTDDFRHSLHWPDRFFTLGKCVNCHSSDDSVLNGEWVYQEKMKGTLAISVLNAIFSLHSLNITREAGWGWSSASGSGNVSMDIGRGSGAPAVPNRIANQRLPFADFRNYHDQMHSGQRMTFDNTSEEYAARAVFLADAIPAISWAAGTGQQSFSGNLDLRQFGSGNWLHSDIKNRSYFEIKKLYDHWVSNL